MAQFGRALRSGRRSRKFESCHSDHIIKGRASALPFIMRFEACNSGFACLQASFSLHYLYFQLHFGEKPVQNLVTPTRKKHPFGCFFQRYSASRAKLICDQLNSLWELNWLCQLYAEYNSASQSEI